MRWRPPRPSNHLSSPSSLSWQFSSCSASSPQSDSGPRQPACLINLTPLRTASKRDRNAQEGCRNGGSILARAFVLTGKQLFQLSLQISRAAVLFCGFECIHGRPVVFPEFIDEG